MFYLIFLILLSKWPKYLFFQNNVKLRPQSSKANPIFQMVPLIHFNDSRIFDSSLLDFFLESVLFLINEQDDLEK